jgi:hypothetical protein
MAIDRPLFPSQQPVLVFYDNNRKVITSAQFLVRGRLSIQNNSKSYRRR